MTFDHTIHIPGLSENEQMQMVKSVGMPDSMNDWLMFLGKDNPGAYTVLREMFKANPDTAALYMGMIAGWDIRGPLLWLLYKDVYKQDVEALYEGIKSTNAPDELAALPYSRYRSPL